MTTTEHYGKYLQRKAKTFQVNGKPQNIGIYLRVQKKLSAFLGQNWYYNDPEQITEDFMLDFQAYLRNKKSARTKRYLSTNTVTQYCSIVANFLLFMGKGDTVKDMPRYRPAVYRADKPLMKKEWITAILQAKPDPSRRSDYQKNFEIVRDTYVFLCFTGLRIGDLILSAEEAGTRKAVSVLPDVIKVENGRYYIDLYTHKRRKRTSVPLSNIAVEILLKYDMWVGFNYPNGKFLDNKTFNTRIKEVAFSAGLTVTAEKVEKPFGRNPRQRQVPVSETVTMHTARVFFITYLKNCGFSKLQIAEIIGTNESNIQRYFRVDDDIRTELHAELNQIVI